MTKRRLWIVLVVITLLGAVYGAAGAVVYQTATATAARCERSPAAWRAQTPAQFANEAYDLNLTMYQMPDYETVTFPSREDHLSLTAWYVPAAQPGTPAVILVHGLNSCRRSPHILLAAGMLRRAGFQVLMLDLRNHGDSAIASGGRMAGGITEYRDVLGAWDWLVNEQRIAPEQIGLFGLSLGAATTLIAAGEESRVAAVWSDSTYSDIEKAILDELTRSGFPTLLAPAGILMGRVMGGVDITARSPLQAALAMEGRPLLVTHGDQDKRMPVYHAHWLADTLAAQGAPVELWIAPGSGHINAMFDHTTEYETRLIDFFTTHLAQPGE